MGVVYSRVIRQVQRFNVENRAFRAIERKKPVSAPKHPSTTKYFKESLNSSNTSKILQEKNVTLDGYLKDVYVSSTGTTPEIMRDKSKLPKSNQSVTDFEFGFWQPDEVPVGKANLANIMKFISDHQGDPKLWNASSIAKEYKLVEEDVENILEYYKTFNLFIPKAAKPTGSLFNLADLKSMNLLESDKPPDKSDKPENPK